MTSISKASKGGQKETSNRYIVLAVKILLVLLILFLLPKLVYGKRAKYNARNKRRRGAEADFQSIRKACEYEICSYLIPEESMNCVQVCISPACYQSMYGDEPLEDGEIDIERAKRFETCAKEELKSLRKRRREAEKKGVPFF